MKTLGALLAVNALFIGANAAGAGVALGLGYAVMQIAPRSAESTLTWLVIGYAAAGAGIAFAVGAVRVLDHNFRRKG